MTADANTWAELARRCEEATGADREIDARVMLALRPELWQEPYIQPRLGRWVRMDGRPDIIDAEGFTASLDAITALIERELPGCGWSVNVESRDFKDYRIAAAVHLDARETPDGPEFWIITASAATPALALCAAFCRAMASTHPHPQESRDG